MKTAGRIVDARALWLALMIGFAVIAATEYRPYTFLKGDSAFYLTTQRALLDSGWLEMKPYHPMSWYSGEMPHYWSMDKAWSNLSLGADGSSYYPKHPYLVALIALPFYALFGPIGSLFFNMAGMAALLVGGFMIARRFCGPGPALIALFPVALSGIVLGNVYTLSNDVFYSALLAMGCAAVLARRDLVSAILLSLAVVAKPTNILWLPAPFIAIALRAWSQQTPTNRRWRSLPPLRELPALLKELLALLKELLAPMLKPALAVLLIGCAAALLNYLMFGNPIHSGYHSIVIVRGGEVHLDSVADAFNQPFWPGLKAQVFDRYQGLWPQGAVLGIAAVLGVVGAWRAGPIAMLPLLVLAAYLGIHARFDYVWARFYLPVAVLAPLGIAAPFCRAADRIGPLWLKTPRQLHALLLVGLAVAIAMIGIGKIAHAPGTSHTLADRLSEAKVTRDDGRRTFNCDYLNPNTMHWECSRLEGQYWQGWGLDIRGECKFTRRANERSLDGGSKLNGAVEGLYFLHPSAAPIRKRLEFADLGPLADLRLHIGYGAASRGTDAKVEIRLNGALIPLPPMHQAGVLHAIGLADKVSPDGANSLTVEVTAGSNHDWRHLCFGADLRRSE